MSAITLASGDSTGFTFDAVGRHATRTATPSGGSLTTIDTYGYLGATNSVIADTSSTSTATVYSAIDAMGDRLGSKNTAGTVAWIIPDLHGNVAAQCGTAGTITDVFRYDAYGRLIGTAAAGTPPVASPWRFQGRLLMSTAGTDVYDFTARAYIPDLGTFASLDSVAGSAQNPLTLNRYLYALANPATMVDPSGHVARMMYDEGGSPGKWTQGNQWNRPLSALTAAQRGEVMSGGTDTSGWAYKVLNQGADYVPVEGVDGDSDGGLNCADYAAGDENNPCVGLADPAGACPWTVCNGSNTLGTAAQNRVWLQGGGTSTDRDRRVCQYAGGSKGMCEYLYPIAPEAHPDFIVPVAALGVATAVVGGAIACAVTAWGPCEAVGAGLGGACNYNPECQDMAKRSASAFSLAYTAVPTGAQNPKLQHIVDDLYKWANQARKVGDGSTMAILRTEVLGQGKEHFDKAFDAMNGLFNVLQDPAVTDADKRLAQFLLNELDAAVLGGH